MTRAIAYFRVSTQRQGASGLGLEAQRAALIGAGYQIVAEFTEVESGRRADRPQIALALAAAKRERCALVTAKLDRLARSVSFISGLIDAGVDFVALDCPHANKLTLHILAAVAEAEAEAISARTKAALKAASARGTKLGWAIPSRQAEAQQARAAGTAAIVASASAFAANVLPIVAQVRGAGITTLHGIAGALNARGVRTARGGDWHASTVRNLLARG